MPNELFIPSMSSSGDVVLTTSLADYRRVLIDNAYSDIPIFRVLNEAGRKRMVNGGISIN